MKYRKKEGMRQKLRNGGRFRKKKSWKIERSQK